MTNTTQNADAAEIAKFAALASRWWDTQGEFKTLHAINPLRLDYIQRLSGGLADKTVLDVGCGGGILSESMALANAQVTGIDLAEESLQVAKLHLHESGVQVDYQHIAVEELAKKQPAGFDVVTCLELLEHVPDPASIVQACKRLVKPGGHVFFSTINRNPKAWMLAVVGAEYVLGMLPKGTHEYAKFICPSELESWARHAGLRAIDATGLHYNPLSRQYRLGPGLDVNYLMAFTK